MGIPILPEDCESQLKDAMLGIASETYSCASSPIQHAAITAYRQPLKDIGLFTDTEICNRILEDNGVALLPGVSFGLPPEAFCARLAYVDFDGKQALEDICLSDWSDNLTEKHAKKMSKASQT